MLIIESVKSRVVLSPPSGAVKRAFTCRCYTEYYGIKCALPWDAQPYGMLHTGHRVALKSLLHTLRHRKQAAL